MKHIILFIIISISALQGQELLEIESAIKIADTISSNPKPGTIRWSGQDFEGWNGVQWVSLTGGKRVGSIEDIDGNNYNTYKIGEETWILENLSTTKFSDGTPIYNANSQSKWDSCATNRIPAYCWFLDNEAAYKEVYGAYYNWYAVSETTNNNKNLCPSGWHVSANSDWDELIDFLGGAGMAGGNLKSVSSLWNEPNVGATNASGFSAIPSGNRGEDGSFGFIGTWAHFWSVDDYSALYSYRYLVQNSDSSIDKAQNLKGMGLSIRCVKN